MLSATAATSAPAGIVYPTRSSQPPNVSTCNHQAPQVNNSSLTRQCWHQNESHTTALPSVHATYPEYFVTPSESTVTRVQRGTCACPTTLTETVGQVPCTCNKACPPKFPDSVVSCQSQTREREMVRSSSFEMESSGCNKRQNLGFPPNLTINSSCVQWQRSVDCPLSSNVGNSEVLQSGMTYPPSLHSTTTVSQGFPLSSTHMQCPQQECPNSTDADPRMLHNCAGPTLNDDVNMIIPGVLKNSEHDHEGSLSRESHGAKVVGDKTNCTSVAGSLLTPTKAAVPRWLSLLPSDTVVDSLKQNGQSRRLGSSVEVGTQTLNVETVATQTDNMDEHEPDHVTKEPLHMSCSPSDLPKKSVETMSVSVGELMRPSSAATGTHQHAGGGHQDLIGFIQVGSDEDTSMEELLATSDLLNNHLGLSVRLSSSQQSMDFSSASKSHSMMVSISE